MIAVKMAHGFAGYLNYWENWVQWAIIVGVFLCTVCFVVEYYDGWQAIVCCTISISPIDSEHNDGPGRHECRTRLAASCRRYCHLSGVVGANDVGWSFAGLWDLRTDVYER